ncbi:dienelactone hydrolase family protein [Tistrella mobilis]|uniref:dienelactone hydrolase family protein n=1 Tax=Tistrella mobilis TaxID=171437 RepID=UPI00355653B5
MTDHSSDLASLVPPVDVTRRGFTLGSLAVGFALAARPVRAETRITTDAAGLEAGAFTLPVSGFDVPCYFARPAGGERLATILVAPEIFGLHEHIADVCRRFAHEGFLAIAFDPFARQGDVTALPDVQTVISTVVSKTPDAQVMADLDAIAAHAAVERGGDPERLGITGFCWGGRTTWLYTAHNPKVKAGVAWYGRLVGPSNEITPHQPVEVAADLAGPVLGLYGGADSGIPVATVEQMRAALTAAGTPAAQASEIIVYPDTPHAFHADYRPSYRPEAAKDGWARCLAWFRDHGLG